MARILDFFSGKLRATAAASQAAKQLQQHQPAAGWRAELEGSAPRLSLGNRIVVTFEDSREGVVARILEPGQPGDDDPPVTLRAGYDVTNLAYRIETKSTLQGSIWVQGLRRNAVYEVMREFHDYYRNLFPVGTRLTYIGRDFLPYHGGHTIRFAEATLYLQEDDDVCRRLGEYLSATGHSA